MRIARNGEGGREGGWRKGDGAGSPNSACTSGVLSGNLDASGTPASPSRNDSSES